MDIKAKVDEIVSKVKGNPDLMNDFKKDPEKTVEGIIGMDIPDGAVDQVVNGVKAALAGDRLGGVADKIKGLF
ncbi:MAG: hypothetical protein IJ733_11045 [Lachnospiraceae bacterium]|nr:hypothetical protein [Lachnospiraceae bacterium]